MTGRRIASPWQYIYVSLRILTTGIQTMKEYVITPQELKELMQTSEPLQLVDVRTPEKHQAFNIGGKLIPLDELPDHLDELERDKLVVTYCTSGGRSMNALMYLMSVGFTRVKSLDGGMTRWQQEL